MKRTPAARPLGAAILLILFFIMMTPSMAQKAEFNADSAFANLNYLAVDLGPRVMGSANEQKALNWTAAKFAAYGADTAYVMPFYKSGTVNTSSGTAVGIFPGKKDSIIVIGGHIDSDRDENPGASDNASGTACVIELARIWSQAPRNYTMIFAAFGAEESGLVGSRHFVKHFEDIDKVALMFSIDMAGSEGWLIPFIDIKTHQTPRWLVQDSYAIDRALGYNSLEYPTHFFTLNSAIGGAGSDHMPFMEKDIPAIDFTAGINIDPIHTTMDRIQFVNKAMIARSGKLVNGLLEKYESQGIPAPKKGHYMLWEIFGGQLFIPKIVLIILVGIALLLGIMAILQQRKIRLFVNEAERVRVSGLKLFGLLILIALAFQSGEMLLQLLKGLRYPWFSPYNTYLFYGGLWVLGGIWIALQITHKWRFSKDPYIYARGALVLLIIFTALFSLLSIRMALYPALALMLLALATTMPNATLRMIFGLLSLFPMMRLMFFETLPFMGRSITNAGFQMTSNQAGFLFTAFLTTLLVIWYLPAIYTAGYLIRSEAPLAQSLKQFRKPLGGLILLVILAAVGGYVYGLPSYDEKWRPEVRLVAEYDVRSSENSLTVVGNEFLRGVSIKAPGLDKQIDGRILSDSLNYTVRADWLTVSGEDSLVSGGEQDTIYARWMMRSSQPWFAVNLDLIPQGAGIDTILSDFAFRHSPEKGYRFRWSAEPPDSILFEGKIVLPKGAKLIRKVDGEYHKLPFQAQATAKYAMVTHRTMVTCSDTLVTD